MKKLIMILMLVLHIPVFHNIYAFDEDIEEFDLDDEIEEEEDLEDEEEPEEEQEETDSN